MRSGWRELDTPTRMSTVVGALGSSVVLFPEAPWLPSWGGINPIVLVEDPLAILFVTIFAVATLTPFLFSAAIVALIFEPLTRESRGVLGFLIFIGIILNFVLSSFLLAGLI